jgi:hypothetical protein
MDRTLIAILAIAAAVMGLTVWLAQPPQLPPVPESDRRYMHCPNCPKEMRYDVAKAKKGCPLCGYEGELIATKKPLAESDPPPNKWWYLIAPLLVEANLLLGALLLYATLRRRRPTKEEEFLYMECVRCHQKLRYRLARVGEVGQCPRCKRRQVFPPPVLEEEEVTGPWWKPRRLWSTVRGQFARLRRSP